MKKPVAGMRTVPSKFGPKETMDRLETEVQRREMRVFARIDHATGAIEAGLELGPTELLIFGSARTGTSLMQSDQTIGIDLPLKALVWQDATGTTWLSYNEPGWIAKRHGVGDHATQIIAAMTAALKAVSEKAAGLG